VRARRHIRDGRPRFEASREHREALARSFFAAVTAGDTDGLVDLLAADVVLFTDGGGQGPAFPQPIHGREHVLRIFGGYRPDVLGAVEQRFTELNGQPGMVFLNAHGQAVSVIGLDIVGGHIIAVRAISTSTGCDPHAARLTSCHWPTRGPVLVIVEDQDAANMSGPGEETP
jgi:RNA polymerase sigma-70 factor (ECF subfamily)